MNTPVIFKFKLVSFVIIALLPFTAIAQQHKHYGLGMSLPLETADLPASRLKAKLESLTSAKRKKALATLRKISFTDQDINDLHVDDNGGVLFADNFQVTASPSSIGQASEQLPASISASEAFSLHSRPGARKIIYLDFDGMLITNSIWNENAAASYDAHPFDLDGSPATFGPDELTAIASIWHRIAEDYMPFNVDVTTKKPRTFGVNTGHILITRNVDKNGVAMPYSGAGGVAYLNVWGQSYFTYASPALVYYNNLNFEAQNIAEAASHEMGHNLGLGHDGTSATGYYSGHGDNLVSWAPIMGVGYYKNVTQWSKGEYADANNQQDDIAIIRGKLGYRADDHGNTLDTATPLVIDAGGGIAASNPETDPLNTNKANKGIIGRLNDTDYFSFFTNGGPINLTITPAWDAFYVAGHRGANLDVKASLYGWDGKLLSSINPVDETNAVISRTLPAGQYYLAVRGVGNANTPYSKYDSLGQYFIKGTITP